MQVWKGTAWKLRTVERRRWNCHLPRLAGKCSPHIDFAEPCCWFRQTWINWVSTMRQWSGLHNVACWIERRRKKHLTCGMTVHILFKAVLFPAQLLSSTYGHGLITFSSFLTSQIRLPSEPPVFIFETNLPHNCSNCSVMLLMKVVSQTFICWPVPILLPT